jgi:hypothetical protein
MVTRFVFFLCLVGCLGSVLQAQDQLPIPLITSETVSDLALSYISQATQIHTLQTRPLLLQEFVPVEMAHRWREDTDYHVAVLNVETGETEATLEAHLGFIDAHENYMLSQNRAGFQIWDLHTYQKVYQVDFPERMIYLPGGRYYGNMRDWTARSSPYLGYYNLFAVQDTQAIVGNHMLFHVIDLETGQEVDRYNNGCEIPEWLSTLLEATCVDTAVVSPFTNGGEKPVLLYPANNLRIDLKGTSAASLTTLDKGTPVSLPIRDIEDMRIESTGHTLVVMGRNNSPDFNALRTIRMFEVFACRIPSENTANVRAEASTQSASLGHLNILYEGNRVGVIAQKQQSDGLWWQLAPGGWVRDDVSKKEGDCTGVTLKDD